MGLPTEQNPTPKVYCIRVCLRPMKSSPTLVPVLLAVRSIFLRRVLTSTKQAAPEALKAQVERNRLPLAAYPTFWISEKGKALKVKDFGIRLYYDSPSGTYNSKEFRELSPVDATKALYRAASGQSTSSASSGSGRARGLPPYIKRVLVHSLSSPLLTVSPSLLTVVARHRPVIYKYAGSLYSKWEWYVSGLL
ncbi:hypothetical protein FA13DRAFT_1788541 [Coprinellus micaceus]|uniref:Uncharacterized protein n=1 Tax=Coprinellus micaceus TaxID=71717 RepID=A0A4Y7TN11_COPMI|nr:hypothetical protein FA13DRAFT_1788541 [Coprinellus micaceus]